MVRITRKKRYADSMRGYDIYIDGKYCGYVKDGEYVDVNVPNGQHTIYLKIDQCTSPVLTFTTMGNEVVEFVCTNYSKNIPHQLLTSLIYTTVKSNEYIKLERIR